MPVEETPEVTGGAPQLFYDSATWENLPRNTWLALYRDGIFATPGHAISVLHPVKVRWYTVEGDYRTAGILDWEKGNPCYTAGGLRRFVAGRRGLGFTARVYLDRADAEQAVFYLRDYGHGSLLDYPGLFWDVSTLDGHQWTAEDLAADLAANWGAPEITAARLWANQWLDDGAKDTSTLFGKW